MTKKNLLIRGIIFAILLAMVIPSFVVRINNEKQNNDVLFALNLNDANLFLSKEEIEQSAAENVAMGVNTAIVEEESINTLINNGFLTAIKYGVLTHKYDDESELIIKELADNKKIHVDSYVIISKRDVWKNYLDKWIPAKYTKEDYVRIETDYNATVYVLLNGIISSWHTELGFDEQKLAFAKENGMNPILSLRLGAYSNTAYIKEVEKLIEEYGVKYIGLKRNDIAQEGHKDAKKNYEAFCELIKKHGLYLILTEEESQLSNKKPIGYQKLIDSAEGRVLRGYETVDFETSNLGATISDKRYQQIVNSVVDRNIRLVSIRQLVNGSDTMDEKSKKTNIATRAAMEKLNEIGYNTDSYDTVYNDYTPYRTLTSMAALVMMALMVLTVIEWLLNKRIMWLEYLALAGSVLGVIFTYFAPDSIVLLYPSLFAFVAPCFAMTLVAVYVRATHHTLKPWIFSLTSILIAVVTLLLCATVQVALLSGLDYYLNSLIFRGIKISLIVPIVYSMVLYPLIFGDTETALFTKIRKVLNAEVKVYWILMALALGGVAAIYLVRSGNVEKISGIETLMRNTISELMPARPRTKEFLAGWPCFVLFLYYVRNTKCTLLRWCFSVGSSILFASVINSFCHVFTSAEIIYTRVLNGLVIGMMVSAAVLVVNCIIVTLVKKYSKEGQ